MFDALRGVFNISQEEKDSQLLLGFFFFFPSFDETGRLSVIFTLGARLIR